MLNAIQQAVAADALAAFRVQQNRTQFGKQTLAEAVYVVRRVPHCIPLVQSGASISTGTVRSMCRNKKAELIEKILLGVRGEGDLVPL